jgi:hypothetical protein
MGGQLDSACTGSPPEGCFERARSRAAAAAAGVITSRFSNTPFQLALPFCSGTS